MTLLIILCLFQKTVSCSLNPVSVSKPTCVWYIHKLHLMVAMGTSDILIKK